MIKNTSYSLFDSLPADAGITFNNRIVMAPVTRCRAVDNLANDMIAAYYRQRATAGLIVSESIAPSPNALTYPRIPGLFSMEQVQSWKKVTAAVHEAGGQIFAQLNHPGRVGSVLNLPTGAKLVGASPVAAKMMVYTNSEGLVKADLPEKLTHADLKATVREFILSAEHAIEAGFDGVEIHGANGYLIEQFLNPEINTRGDSYGGDLTGRCRFALEIAEGIATAIGAERTGIRFSPYNTNADMPHYQQINDTYRYLASKMNDLGLLYIHLVDSVSRLEQDLSYIPLIDTCFKEIRQHYKGILILNGGFTRESAMDAIETGKADMISFGKHFISNPDLPFRLQHDLELNPADAATFYSGAEKGYIDYPWYQPG